MAKPKVHVGGSIAHAYEFLFGRFFQMVGTGWLPALLYGIGLYVYFVHLQPLPMHGEAAAAMVTAVLSAIAIKLLSLVIVAVLAISLTQQAFGIRHDVVFAHFVLGPRELRLFLAKFRYYLLFLVLLAVVTALCIGAMFAAQKYGAGLVPKVRPLGQPLAVLAAALFAVVLAVWFGLSMLRLAFILPAVASVEHRTLLLRAWEITRGNGWRIFFVYVVTLVPVAIGAAIAGYFLLGSNDVMNLMAAIGRAKQGSPPPIAEFVVAHAFNLAALYAGVALAAGSLLAGASAFVYRTVTGHEEAELEDDAALVAPLLAPAVVAPVAVAPVAVAPAVVAVPVEEPAPAPVDHGHGEDHGHGHTEPHRDESHGHRDSHARDDADTDDDDSEDDRVDDDRHHHHEDRDARDEHHGHGHSHGHGDHAHASDADAATHGHREHEPA